MAGQIKANSVQLGDSATATNNFVWQTNVDGTAKLARGNVGATTQDILTVDAAGKVTLTQGLQAINRFVSAAQTITIAGSLTLAHGLGAKPYRIFTTLVCTTAEYGYSIGDELIIPYHQISSSAVDGYGLSITIDVTNINIRFGAGPTTVFLSVNKTTGVGVNLTNANWQLYVRAEL